MVETALLEAILIFAVVQRLLCKKFAKHARSRVFTRVKIRFSERGFDRKEFAIVIEPEVASGVQKLSYMVHDLYPQGKMS